MIARLELADQGRPKGYRYLIIKCDGIRIADVFPDAGMYRGKVEPQWIIDQARLLVGTMNATIDELEAAP